MHDRECGILHTPPWRRTPDHEPPAVISQTFYNTAGDLLFHSKVTSLHLLLIGQMPECPPTSMSSTRARASPQRPRLPDPAHQNSKIVPAPSHTIIQRAKTHSRFSRHMTRAVGTSSSVRTQSLGAEKESIESSSYFHSRVNGLSHGVHIRMSLSSLSMNSCTC